MKKARILLWFLCLCLIVCSVCPACAETPAQTTLHVACVSADAYFYEPLIANYEASRPDIHVELHLMEEEELRKSLYAKTDGIDLYAIASNRTSQAYLLENELILPIDSELVVNNIKTMYPQVQNYVTSNGVVWGYPFYIRGQYWTVDEALMQLYSMEKPATYLDFLAQMEYWCQRQLNQTETCAFTDYAKHGDERANVVGTMVLAHLNHQLAEGESLTFDTPEFRALLAATEPLTPYTQISVKDAEKAVFTFEGISPVSYYGETTNLRYILPPAIAAGSEPSVTAYLDYLVISAATSQKEEATAFVEAYLQFGELSDELYPYQVAKREDNLIANEKPAANITAFHKLAAHWRLDAAPIIGALYEHESVETIVARYLDGTADLEQTVAAMDALLQETLSDLSQLGWRE